MPARLIYTPKSFVYVKNAYGDINDLSPYVVSGQVQRLIDQVSTATITLRNPMKRFTTPKSGAPFHPMDPITIYLERVPGFPVRVFTGYLDTTPYYQMYPGTITLQASCTLKRLLYNYFDPSLPFVTSFFEQYGWINTGQGSIISQKSFNTTKQGASVQDVINGKTPFNQLQDGSLGKLLWAILYNMAQWQDANIWIEPLPNGPNGLAARMATLMKTIDQENQVANDALTTFLSAVIGQGGQGTGGGPAAGSSATGGVGVNGGALTSATIKGSPARPDQLANLNTALGVAQQLGANTIATTAMVFAGIAENSWTATTSPSNPTHHGIFQSTSYATDDVAGAAKGFLTGGPSFGGGGAIAQAKMISDPVIIAQNVEVGGSYAGESGYALFLPEAKAIVAGFMANSSKAGSGNAVATATTNPISGTGGSTSPTVNGPATAATGQSMTRIDAMKEAANAIDGKHYAYAWGGGHEQVGVPSTHPPHASGGSPVLGFDCSGAVASVLYAAGLFPSGSVGRDDSVPAAAGLAQGVDNSPGAVNVFDNPGVHIFMQIDGHFWGTWAGGSSTAGGGGWLSDGNTSGFVPYHVPQAQLAQQTTYKLSLTGGGTNVPGGTGTNSGTGTGAATSISGSSEAFAAQLTFPSIEEQVTALMLGEQHKGLMHDQPLMPFIQQVAQASMRSFQSLPNGDFYAFYPDYFGEMGHHAPYWMIDDIETLNGGINISDDPLVTHMFAVGDNCLALDTPMPTPTGWTTMGALKRGDMIFGSDGYPTKILSVSDTHLNHDCYELIFEDGSSIIADGGHRWEVRTYQRCNRRAIDGDSQCGVYTTKEMIDKGLYTDLLNGNRRRNFRIKVTQPLELPDQSLPIDPYILGVWLGDGDKDSCRITCGDEDQAALLDQITLAGYRYRAVYKQATGYSAGSYYWKTTIYGLHDHLRTLGVLNNKHIPAIYQRASKDQRLALLQGLMDTDGCIGNYCENNQTNERLATDLRSLVCGLGLKGNRNLVPERNGSLCQYAINFAPREHLNVFRLPRKAIRYAARLATRTTCTSGYRAIVEIKPVPSVPVRCISVATKDHLYLAGETMIPTHNTWPVSQELLNELFSAGTISIFNAFLPSGILDTSSSQTSPDGMANVMSLAEASDFIKRYGARPLVNNYPMVRSPIYEMLLAYQQFMLSWSKQFLTPFSFTFMPELFPGGKVGFPHHGLQMYINSVTHTWDYEGGGFTTTADLMAPSVLDGSSSATNPDLPALMVAAMVEPIRGQVGSSSESAQRFTAGQQQAATKVAQQTGKEVNKVLTGITAVL